MASYDEHYQSEELFGAPYPELIRYFEGLPHRGTILDLGCGQGRDAIPLARLGFRVLGVDLSEVGIRQMLEKTKREELPVEGAVADIYTFQPAQAVDIVLLNSIIHFGKQELDQELELLRRMKSMTQRLVLCIKESPQRRKAVDTFFAGEECWGTEVDDLLSYTFVDQASEHSSTTTYRMLGLVNTS